MNDTEYRYFYEVAKTLNFNRAAKNLYISQPALSRCIEKLEEEFQAQLFFRSKRSVTLTDAGITLLNNYPLVQKAVFDLHEKVINTSMGIHSKLTIGIQDGHMITPLFKKILDHFQDQNPNIPIEILSTPYIHLFDELISRTIDFALCLEFPDHPHPNIDVCLIEALDSYAIINPTHPAALEINPEEGLKKLNGNDLLLVKWSIVPNATSFILNQCAANGFTPANIHYASSYFTLYNWLITGKGFVIMDKQAIFNESLLTFLPLIHEKKINLCLYWNQDITNTAVMKFLTYMKEGDKP